MLGDRGQVRQTGPSLVDLCLQGQHPVPTGLIHGRHIYSGSGVCCLPMRQVKMLIGSVSKNAGTTLETLVGLVLVPRHQSCSTMQVASMSENVRNEVATLLLRLTLHELFTWRFMQTDPNWGNFLYDEPSGRLHLIDFGVSQPCHASFKHPCRTRTPRDDPGHASEGRKKTKKFHILLSKLLSEQQPRQC